MKSSSKIDKKIVKQKSPDFDIKKLSNDHKLNKLLESIISGIRGYAEHQIKHIKRRAQIGIALSVEKNINKLLEMILDEAKAMSNADAGTLYIVDDDKKYLRFEIMQNDTLKTRIGGTSGVKSTLPNVPLYKDGKPNHFNVSSYVAITGETVNIPDVYEAEGFDFTGVRKYDAATGYRSKSMLVIALKNHENDIIGVLQLLNAQVPETDELIAFSPEYENHVASLASQAAVALTNAQLIQDLRNLFYAFIKSIATAIDEKSPYTGGHIKRVVDLTMMIAEKINESDEGAFKDVCFNEEEMEELRLAAWMHDVGKITTPENIVDKATKLTTIFDRISLIENRFKLIAKTIENNYLKQKIELLKNGDSNKTKIKFLEENLTNTLKNLQEDLEFIKECNNPGEFISDEKISSIKEIASNIYFINNKKYNYLSKDEVKNLCIRKGSLTEEERKIIENHATMTYKMLKQLPFSKQLSNVPEYAGSHHEKLDGSGYPRGLTLKDLALQSRIMVIADIFEALTAKDRPYKKPMNLSNALKIMGFMKNDNHIDADIYDLFITSGFCYEYARKEMNPE